ncbi:uncharacterized protein [Ptychodera flava]|uniref:uncharacterized protein n=1 Tax=Ptychodera flava TaxID=63121 RepID=UPI003969C328
MVDYHGQTGNMNACLFVVLMLLTRAISLRADGRLRLVTETTHVALSTDVTVEYKPRNHASLESGGFVVLNDLASGEELARKEITGETDGFVIFDCSYFDHVGEFKFKIYDSNDNLLAASEILDVQWPKVDFVHARTHVAMTTGVSVTVRIDGSVCKLFDHNRYETIVIAEFVGTNHSSVAQHGIEAIPVAQDNIDHLQLINEAQFPCGVFDRAGLYQFVLLSSYGDYFSNDSLVDISSYLQVVWSENYHIQVHSSTIFPCEHAVTVGFTTPSCRTTSNKVRVFRQESFSAPLGAMLEYETERRVSGDSIDVECEVFDSSPDIAGYCFKYISVSELTGAVHEQGQSCVSSKMQKVDGAWGEWAAWTACTVTCGEGIKSRYRLCDSPTPANGGSDCEGHSVENTRCRAAKECAHEVTTVMSTHSPVDDYCSCGCKFHKLRGTIEFANTPCEQNPVWIISLNEGLKINLTFLTFDLDMGGEWLRVRNGGFSSAPLIVYHTGNRPPKSVLSSGNELYIEYHTEYDVPLPNTGFSAAYTSLNSTNKIITPLTTPTKGMSTENLVNSVVTVAGIAICGIIIITSIAFALHARARVHKKRRERAVGMTSGDLIGHMHMMDTSHGSASWNLDVSSTGQSMQRLFALPASSMSEASSFSMRRARDRGYLYQIRDDEELKPGIHYTSPYHDSSYTSVSKSNDPHSKMVSPNHSPKHSRKNRQQSRQLSAPYNVGRSGSLSGSSRHSSGRTDKNTLHLAVRTPDEYAKGYSVSGSHTTFDTRYTADGRDTKYSRSSREYKPSSRTYSDGSKPSMVSEATSPPYVNREGKLTPLGMAVARTMEDDGMEYGKTPYKNEVPSHSKKREHRGKRRDSDRDRSPGSRSGGSSRHRRHERERDRDRTPTRDGRDYSRNTRSRSAPDRHRRDGSRPMYYDSYDSNRTPPRDSTKHKRQGKSGRSGHRDMSRMPRTLSMEAANRAKNFIDHDPWQMRETDTGEDPSAVKETEEILKRIKQEQPREQLRLSYISSAESLPKRNRHSGPRSPESEVDVLSDPPPGSSTVSKPLEHRTMSAGNTLRATSPEGLTPFRPSNRRRPDTPSSRSSLRTNSGPGTPRKTNKFGQSDISISQDEPEYDDYMPTLPGSYFDMSPVYQLQRTLKAGTTGYQGENDLDSINANLPPSTV